MSIVFPTLPMVHYDFEEKVSLPAVKSGAEAGYVAQRSKFTKAKRTWKLSYDALTDANVLVLENFYIENRTNHFTWVHPLTKVSYLVQFDCDELTYGTPAPGHRKVDFQIREV